MWLHKSQIELSTDKQSAGNINAAAFLPQTRVTVPLTAPQQTPQKQEAA